MLSTATASKKYTLEHLALPRKHKGWFIRQAASKTHALLAECFGSVQTVPQLQIGRASCRERVCQYV